MERGTSMLDDPFVRESQAPGSIREGRPYESRLGARPPGWVERAARPPQCVGQDSNQPAGGGWVAATWVPLCPADAAFDVALQPAVVPYASPLKLMEYLALGKAIVAPMQPNLLEILEHDVNAWMFDSHGDGALAAALTRVCGDSALRARLATAAHQTIDRLGLTWEANARRVEALALELLRGEGSLPAQQAVC